jgi:hypothetical protein
MPWWGWRFTPEQCNNLPSSQDIIASPVMK